jgi:plasmid stabilization system protein ParE
MLHEMTTDRGFELHPGAAQNITEIWEYIVEDNPLAARRVREEILDTGAAICRGACRRSWP